MRFEDIMVQCWNPHSNLARLVLSGPTYGELAANIFETVLNLINL